MENRYSIKLFMEADMSEFKDLIEKYWNADHIFLQSDALLRWQYEGYGEYKGMHFPILFDNDKMIGFRGIYPAEIRIPMNSSFKIEPVGIGSMYLVIPEYRGQKLGLALQQYTTQYYKNYFAIASNLKTSAPIYRKNGYFMLDQMLRYIIPLHKNYGDLLVNLNRQYLSDIKEIPSHTELPVTISSIALEEFWSKSLGNKKILAINKTRDFWNWRFINHPVYQYLFFGGAGRGGLIVARVCDLYNDDHTLRENKVFRILELVPEKSDVWDGDYSTQLSDLLTGVLNWAQQAGCCAAEFYTTTHCFEKTLSHIGMKEINEKETNSYLDCISYFEPCSSTPRLSNVSLYLSDYTGEINFDFTYFTLSDADQDRPNIIKNE